MMIIFFLEKNLPEKQRSLVEEKLRQSSLIEEVQFISPEQALEQFQNNFPELRRIIENLRVNPLPSSFEATISEENFSSVETLAFIQEMREMNGIEDIQFNRDWVEKMQSLSRLAQAVGFFLGGILVLASFFIISNVIKLNVFARHEEIEILRLVGATNTFIRIPFLMEGMILGILGGLVSLLLIFFLIKFFPLYLGVSLGVFSELINFRYLSLSQIIMLIATGAFIGFSGSLSSLARFLKV
ncbi:MAG: FtsX-like permease family protein [Candidatus Aminicenantes bacterium]|nr:FtsX-like permease family protein [Candidatus Aminicenantes bacterium]